MKSAKQTPTNRRGAPRGNRNAFKHGRYSRARLTLLAEIRAHIKMGRWLVKAVHSNLASVDHAHK